jgi:hypothetical protein
VALDLAGLAVGGTGAQRDQLAPAAARQERRIRLVDVAAQVHVRALREQRQRLALVGEPAVAERVVGQRQHQLVGGRRRREGRGQKALAQAQPAVILIVGGQQRGVQAEDAHAPAAPGQGRAEAAGARQQGRGLVAGRIAVLGRAGGERLHRGQARCKAAVVCEAPQQAVAIPGPTERGIERLLAAAQEPEQAHHVDVVALDLALGVVVAGHTVDPRRRQPDRLGQALDRRARRRVLVGHRRPRQAASRERDVAGQEHRVRPRHLALGHQPARVLDEAVDHHRLIPAVAVVSVSGVQVRDVQKGEQRLVVGARHLLDDTASLRRRVWRRSGRRRDRRSGPTAPALAAPLLRRRCARSAWARAC